MLSHPAPIPFNLLLAERQKKSIRPARKFGIRQQVLSFKSLAKLPKTSVKKKPIKSCKVIHQAPVFLPG